MSSKPLPELQRLFLVRMAGNKKARGCDGCWKWKARFLLLLGLSVLMGSLWVLCEVKECDFLWRKEKVCGVLETRNQVSLEQFNASESKVQALASLLSSVDQCMSSKCLDNSTSDWLLENSISHALQVLCSEWDQSQCIGERIDFQDQCSVLDEYVSKESISSSKDELMPDDFLDSDSITPLVVIDDITLREESQDIPQTRKSLESKEVHPGKPSKLLLIVFWSVLVVMVCVCKASRCRGRLWMSSCQQTQQKQQQQKQHYQSHHSKVGGRWRKSILFLGVFLGVLVSLWIFLSMKADIISRRRETLATMCDERARMLQDQFNVSMNHVHALAILISTFHHGKLPSAIDQRTFAEYTARTAFERPLMSGVAYALKVPHSLREQFEKQHGWQIKKMETEDQSPVQDEYIPEKLDPSPVQDEYAPVIFSQETVSHIVSVDMMSGKEDRENIMRARATGKGVLTSPFNLLKSNHLGVVLTFAVYNTDLPPETTSEERIDSTVGYLGASFDVPSLVEKLLQQLASKQIIIVNVYDTTNSSAPIRMYGPDIVGSGELRISNLDFGDPLRRHEMHCRFKQEPPPPWSAITTSLGVAVIVLLVGHILHAAVNRIEKVEDDYREMRELKVRAEAADVAKSQFLATVSHEIRTPMNGVLGMLQMLMDTNLDTTQQDFAMTAQASGKALIALINEVLDQAKIESGRLELEAVSFDVRNVLDNVLSQFCDKSQVKGIELAVYISNRVPEFLIGDPGRFRQIITNLVGNAVKFTEEGHIFVSVHLVEEVKSLSDVTNRVSKQSLSLLDKGISYSNTLSGYQVVDRWKSWENFSMFMLPTEATDAINLLVTVEDTGVGIPLNAQSRIFMPFMQADSSTSRTYGGTGIGLSISKWLVDRMGGEIGFVSRPGTGSTFSFTAVFGEGQRSSVDIKRHHLDGMEQNLSDFNGMKGLVVDGRGIRAEVTKYHLERLGIQVEIAADLKTALSCLSDSFNSSKSGCVDMVLVDKDAWGEGSGLAFPCSLQELRQNGKVNLPGKLPKMLLLATFLSPSEVNDLKSAGYADSLIKPLRLSMIDGCLRKLLGVGNKRYQERGKPVALRSLLSGKQILVVDDNAVNRKVAEGALKKYGALVTCADSGKAALELLQPPHKFNACFMDVQMPEMDGFEATKQIRSVENKVNELIKSGEASPTDMYGNVTNWHVPILAMTADVFQATHEECARCGMDDYVSKPFEEEQLYSAVAHFFESDTADAAS
ncbi:putative histidine kinase 5 [Iris pallida]|uniref:histidine kinase n=1 Tax=Iris pallida TaxID=29817 RepID=A0AAX6F8V0_IRIPA|nr:putative histidine kinase 5 [Iris pallida]